MSLNSNWNAGYASFPPQTLGQALMAVLLNWIDIFMARIPFGRTLILFGLSVILISLATLPGRADNPINPETCTYNGIPLYGEVQAVESFPDIKVQTVSSFPDLKVQVVSSFPDDCGQWQFTNSFPDFKIQFVDSFPDIKIQFVESFPGIP